MNKKTIQRIQFSIFNLMLVAILGVIMRYKIGFEFPYLDQKHLQHAHSHFAFYGWVSHTLMTLMIEFLERESIKLNAKKFDYIIILNLVCSYGMLLSFSIWGYNALSITFSTIAILNSYYFAYTFIQNSKTLIQKSYSVKWFIASLIFNILSSIGTFTLAYLMITKDIPQQLYLGSVYFFLHFQYNGWFFFASIGLFLYLLKDRIPEFKESKYAFYLLAISCIPAYLLSTLWAKLPIWLYIIVIIASFTQFTGWIILLNSFRKQLSIIKLKTNPIIHYLLIILGIAISIKFLLQLGSVIPSISQLAFGFRPIVIAYLHLILLAIISVFLLTFLVVNEVLPINRKMKFGINLLVSCIYLTEIILAVQGIASFTYTVIPFINELLFILSCIMLIGILIIVWNFVVNVKT